jgi:hypothetical protein
MRNIIIETGDSVIYCPFVVNNTLQNVVSIYMTYYAKTITNCLVCRW